MLTGSIARIGRSARRRNMALRVAVCHAAEKAATLMLGPATVYAKVTGETLHDRLDRPAE